MLDVGFKSQHPASIDFKVKICHLPFAICHLRFIIAWTAFSAMTDDKSQMANGKFFG
jgi:hypothetical protein